MTTPDVRSTGVLLAHTEPASEDLVGELNRWYDEVHIPEVVSQVPGIVAARRYSLAPEQLLPGEALPDRRFLAVYDIEGESIQDVAAALGAGLEDGSLTLTPALHPDRGPVLVFYAATP